jgi:hypothetical protein
LIAGKCGAARRFLVEDFESGILAQVVVFGLQAKGLDPGETNSLLEREGSVPVSVNRVPTFFLGSGVGPLEDPGVGPAFFALLGEPLPLHGHLDVLSQRAPSVFRHQIAGIPDTEDMEVLAELLAFFDLRLQPEGGLDPIVLPHAGGGEFWKGA